MTAERDIIVVGASAGGIQPMGALIETLPQSLEAAIFVTIHIAPYETSILPRIFSRNGGLPAVQAQDGMPIEHGRIYVAPPDHHLMVERNRMTLWRGPRESYHRPAINALFRSAAIAFGPRVIGTILSGMLDDGVAGLWQIKKSGGLAIVQNPETAAFPDMPLNALKYIQADYVLPPAEIGSKIGQLVQTAGG